MSYPTVVALDTDWTIWQRYLDHTKWGRGGGALKPIEDNIERPNHDPKLLRDRSNLNHSIRVFDDISRVVNDILRHDAKLAIVSRNPSKAMCDRALYYFNTINPSDNKEWSIIHLVKYDEVADERKVRPFRRIHQWSGSDFSDMVLFDDEAFNNEVRIELGVTFQFLRENRGLTWEAYQRGIDAWRRAKRVTILTNPQTARKRVHIGYTGLPTFWINLVRNGEGIVDVKTPYRWGYALYVAPSSPLARFFRDWARRDGFEAYVCQVFVKDYDAWKQINKVWIPEHNGNLPQMNNMNWNLEASGRNQENRDRFIANNWKVPTPYVLFSRHHWMPGLPLPVRRFTEMVVYTQIQRSLFEVVPLSDAEVNRIGAHCPFEYRFQFNEWRIIVPHATSEEFRRFGERQFHQLSLSAPRP